MAIIRVSDFAILTGARLSFGSRAPSKKYPGEVLFSILLHIASSYLDFIFTV